MWREESEFESMTPITFCKEFAIPVLSLFRSFGQLVVRKPAFVTAGCLPPLLCSESQRPPRLQEAQLPYSQAPSTGLSATFSPDLGGDNSATSLLVHFFLRYSQIP